VYIGVKTTENLIKNPLSAYPTLSLQALYSIARVGGVQRSNAKLADLFLCVLAKENKTARFGLGFSHPIM
jgi:hypothetical protein